MTTTVPLPRRTPLAAWNLMAERAPERSDFDAFAAGETHDDRFSPDRLRRISAAIEEIPESVDP
ncbi:hypothetical protein AB0A05_27480 [Streptomyces sp. NPDC046374]|uniref:hypothetical protein n=1 Tax=Streptomyces sp. NPDC046374 TaxID=3154917 RepID=UPI0033F05AB2